MTSCLKSSCIDSPQRRSPLAKDSQKLSKNLDGPGRTGTNRVWPGWAAGPDRAGSQEVFREKQTEQHRNLFLLQICI